MSVIQALIDGLLIGGVYAVLSVGLSLVFGIMGIVNFAHGAFLMVGMYVAYFLWRYLGLDPLIGAFGAFALVFVGGMVLQRALIKPVLKAPEVAQIFLTVGLLITLENGALLLFGADYRSVSTSYQVMGLNLGGLIVSMPYLLAFLLSVASAMGLWLFMRRTRLGRAMRATAQDPMAARIVGINPDRMHQIAFGLGVGLTAFGGAVILPYLTASPTIGTNFVVLMFTAVVLGGLGSVAGALVGGLSVGVIQSISGLLLPIQQQNLVLFLIFILVLALRPSGLLRSATS